LKKMFDTTIYGMLKLYQLNLCLAGTHLSAGFFGL